MKRKSEKQRIYFVYILFFLLFLGLLVKITYLQIVQKDTYRTLARSQHTKIIPLKGERGRIYDRKGRILATNINVYSVFADPELIDDPDETARKLAPHIDMQQELLRNKLAKKSRFVWLERHKSPREKDAIRRENIKGIGFVKSKMRFYPQGELGAHVLGGVNVDSVGIEGVELYFDSYLRGKDGLVSVMRDSASRNLYFSPQILQPQKGMDLYLTIDAQIQYWAESFLQKTLQAYAAKGGSVVVLDAENGEILALTNAPAFDPNRLGAYPKEHIRNAAITDVFEPGSVFKIVTLLAALEKRAFRLDETIYCEKGLYKIPGALLHDWRKYGDLSFVDVFKKSSNIGVAKIATTMGPHHVYSYITKMGFGAKTGIDLPGEVRGLLKPVGDWSRTSGYIIPIGQEIGVTMVQLARAMCAIANGGDLIRPHVTKELVGAYGYTKKTQPIRHTALARWATSRARNILIGVVEEGTAKRAQIDDAVIGGKTGTAQKFDVTLGKYSPSAYRASFVGFVEHPPHTIVICVSIDEPRKISHFGGVVAAPLFKKIAEKIIYYSISEKAIVKK